MNSPDYVHVVANLFGMQKAGQKRTERFAEQLNDLRNSEYASRMADVDDIIATSPVPGEVAKQLDDRVKYGDTVALLVGDGSLKNVIQDVFQHSYNPAVKQANFLLLNGGFACDTYRELHPQKRFRSPSRILDAGQVIQFSPMEWRFQSDEQDDTQFGISYGTFGLSALMALTVNRPNVREWTGDNKLKKVLACIPEAVRAGTFPVQFVCEDAERIVYDMGYANGSNMGGNSDVFPVRLQDASLFHYQLDTPNFVSAAIKASTGSLHGDIVTTPQRFFLPEATVSQIDGEATVLGPETWASVRRSNESLTFYTSRQAA